MPTHERRASGEAVRFPAIPVREILAPCYDVKKPMNQATNIENFGPGNMHLVTSAHTSAICIKGNQVIGRIAAWCASIYG